MPSHGSYRGHRSPQAILRFEGKYWTIVYGGTVVRLRDSKGLRYLEQLLRHPGREFHVAELTAATARTNGRPEKKATGVVLVERTRKAVTNRIRQTVARMRVAHAPLGLHLGNPVHTGTTCAYTPDEPMTVPGTGSLS